MATHGFSSVLFYTVQQETQGPKSKATRWEVSRCLLAGERAKLTNTAFAGGNNPLCWQNRIARCVLVARWRAVTCCTAAAMSAAEDRICPFSMPSSFSFLWISLSITCWSPVKEKLQFLAFCMGGLRVKWNRSPSLAKCSIAFPPLIVEYSGRLIKESLLATY